MASYGDAEYGVDAYGTLSAPSGPDSTYGVGVYGVAVYGGSSVSTVRATRTWIEAA
jgi:hypothetical protein